MQLWTFSQQRFRAVPERFGLAERTFKRRFAHATGMGPLDYVQHLRLEEAKQRLE